LKKINDNVRIEDIQAKDNAIKIHDGNKSTKCKKPIMVGPQTFMHASKEGTTFAIYALLINKICKSCSQISNQVVSRFY